MEYLKRFALWFISGLGVAAGAMVVVFASDYLRPRNFHIEDSNVSLEKIAISDVEVSDITKHLTVTGTVTNNLSEMLRIARLNIQLVRGEKILFECGDSLSTLPDPGQTVRFQSDCREIEKASIPADSTVRVKVWFAQSR